jgi:hypothetical protein
MRTVWRIGLVAAVVLSLLFAALVVAFLFFELPHENVRIFIDGELIELPALTTVHWLVAAFVIALVTLVMMIVLPLVLALAIGIPLLVLAGVLGLALSPLLLIGALIVWLSRRPTRTIAR